jgi:AraC family transcriptional regulator of adaptative response/methylated-DNA-[protein]-cysteine methyltransferase
MMSLTMDDETRLARVRARDASADGEFFYAVLTTGVFCYPSCAARPARPENMRFYDSREDAVRAGYRPCQRCRPDLAPRAARASAAVTAACRAIEQGVFDIDRAAEAACLGRAAFIRLFRGVAGVTPTAYAAAWRARVAQAALTAGAPVTEAIYDAGFSSSGRFYEAADGMLGMTPTRWRQGGAGETITYAFGESFVGSVLVATTARGICAILLGESRDALVADLRGRFGRAVLAEAAPDAAARVAEIVALIDAPRAAHSLPLDIRGTAFQRRVWAALREIPAGQTVSYGALAARLGMPKAARAVGSACAANNLAVAVPCHRVVTRAGAVTGYAWGPARKLALLAREK